MSDLTKLQSAEPVLITDGTLAATIMTTTPTGSEPGIVVRNIQNAAIAFTNTDSYGFAATSSTLTVNANTVVPLAYLWHPASVSKSYQIQQIVVTAVNGSTSPGTIKVAKITAEPSSPGGTLTLPVSFNSASPNSAAVLRAFPSGTPTRGGDIFHRAFFGTNTIPVVIDIKVFSDVTGPTCRASVAEGWEVRLDNGQNTNNNLRISVEITWTEA